ncbi:MAG TPA: hypothetical protein DDX98_14345 [Bacteroidales bacterium]|jgi:hypothetical protein|nr:hypothetical protein [Bacteroidales bacterium]
MKNLLGGLLLVLSISVSGQISDPIALLNTVHETTGSIPDTAKKLFRNSEPPGISFLVSSNIRENKLHIKTNYGGEYKVRFIDYYARTRKVFKHNYNDIVLDLAEFEKSIFIMNIMDSDNRTLTSQIINLKRRHL